MYKLFIVLIIFFNNYQNVDCSFFDFLADQLNELKSYVLSTLMDISHYIKSNLLPNDGLEASKQRINIPIRLYRPEPFESPTTELNTAHRRVLDSHVVRTRDGYILTLHRISPGTAKERRTGSRIVLLHHGLLGSSEDWLLLGPDKSLPYLLSDSGFDVWLANSRGNCYSRGHESLKTNLKEYWNFSFQEIGVYDIPAILQYIRNTTNTTEAINYVGHSMGTTALLALLSTERKYNEYFRIAILLAPLAIMSRTRGPLKTLAPLMADPPEVLLSDLFGIGEFMPSRQVPTCMANEICKGIKMLCTNSLLFFSGGLLQEGSRDANFIARLLYHVPAGGSTNTILHYAQLIKNKKFHKFGKIDEEFKLRDITTPVAIFSSSDDWLSDVDDNQILYVNIANPVGHIIFRDKNISHTEFVWGFHADKLIFYKITDLIENGPTINEVK